jgi:hypothetical protein
MFRWLLLIIFNRSVSRRILAFFLAIRLLELLLLLFLLFQLSIHGVSALSNLIDKLVFIEVFLRLFLVFIFIRWDHWLLIFVCLNLFIACLDNFLNIFRGILGSLSLKGNSLLFWFFSYRINLIWCIFRLFLQFLRILISFINDLLMTGLQFLNLLRQLGIFLLKFSELECLLLSNLFGVLCFWRGSVPYLVKLTL